MQSPISTALARGAKRGLFSSLLGAAPAAGAPAALGGRLADEPAPAPAPAPPAAASASAAAAAAARSPEPRSLLQRMAMRQNYLSGQKGERDECGPLAAQGAGAGAGAGDAHFGGAVLAASELFAPPEMQAFFAPQRAPPAGERASMLTEGL